MEIACGMAYTISLLSGRWKLSVLGFLMDEEKLRYSELKSKMPEITEKMLAAQLKELEKDGLLERTAYPQVPPKVEYKLSPKGRSLESIFIQMTDWGERNRKK